MAYISLLDMFDGGGAGASGSEFKGGPVSGLLNRLGVRPAGYADRTASMDVMPPRRPSRPQPPMAVRSAPAPRPEPVVTLPIPDPNAAWNRQMPMTEPALPPKQYSGRGYVGMPMMPIFGADPLYSETLRYLREKGLVDY